MEKTIIAILLIILTTCFVLADNWSDFTDEFPEEDFPQENYTEPAQTQPPQDTKTTPQKPETKFTTEFYIALIMIFVVILIIIYLIYSLLKRPKNKWEK